MSCCLALIALTYVAETKFLGLYMKGHKIGYASYREEPVKVNGRLLIRSDSVMHAGIGMSGDLMKVDERTTSWTDKLGTPVRSMNRTTSSGRTDITETIYGPKSVVFHIDNNGIKSTRTVAKPKDAPVVEDAIQMVINHGIKTGYASTVYVIDESTNSFEKTAVSVKGLVSTTVRGKPVKARLVELSEQGILTSVYLSKSGDVVRVVGPAGIEMLPVSRQVALAGVEKYDPSVDLSEATSIKSDRAMPDAENCSGLKLVIQSKALPDVKSSPFETISKVPDGFSLDIHPPVAAKDPKQTIDRVAAQKPEWLKPSLDMPSDSAKFKAVAKKIVGDTKDAQAATFAIQRYVYQLMRPNAGIGVLRDATEILNTKEGVCRDYAVLTVTLLRAGQIPARLASGLVSWDGTFYYHMWAEAWDGTNWIGVDSTTDKFQLSATHIKFGEGNVDTAYAFSFLDKAKIHVVEMRKD